MAKPGGKIIECPRCNRYYRIPKGVTLDPATRFRCTKCGHAFSPGVPEKAEPIEPPKRNQTEKPRVLVASDGPEVGGLISEVLLQGGYETRAVYAGDEAWAQIQIWHPRAAVIDVGLPGMPVFEICDRVRSHPESRRLAIILLASVYQYTRYKRSPTSLYGADDYIEKHHLRDSLTRKISRLLVEGASSSHSREERTTTRRTIPSPEIAARDEKNMVYEEQFGASGTVPEGEETRHEGLRRFARIIVSDIALYNQEKIEEGIRRKNIYETLKADIEEGRRLYETRLTPGAGVEREFFKQALAEYIEKQRAALQGKNRSSGGGG